MAHAVDTSSFPPHVLREYALLADGERGVLVGPRGDLAWMCFPRWDSPAIFSTLIGGSGVYAIAPTERAVWGGWYEEGTLIWHSRWVTDTGAIVECREALALPADPQHAVVLRRLTALQGSVRAEALLDARADFGRTPLSRIARDDDGCWHGRLGSIELRFRGPAGASVHPDGHRGKELLQRIELEPGEHCDFVLGLSAASGEWKLPDAEATWSGTEAAWQERVPDLGEIHAVRDARHAYAVLAGLTSGGGGMVAAATAALPERAQEGRAYDYRYVWIRDQCIAGQAVAAAGAHALLDDAVRFVTERLLDDGAGLVPIYTTTGERASAETRVGLPGYPGGADVVGNDARDQFQLDTSASRSCSMRRPAVTVQAARWFERNRAACGPPGLLSEEFDVTQRQLRGNLPQAFVHALLLECAVDSRWQAG